MFTRYVVTVNIWVLSPYEVVERSYR